MNNLKLGINSATYLRHGLIGYWPLNERSLARDQSGAGNDGTVDGAIFNDNYAQFDGNDDRILLPSPYTTEILSNSTKTINIWAFFLGEEVGSSQRLFSFYWASPGSTAFEIQTGGIPPGFNNPAFRFRYRTSSGLAEIGNEDLTPFLNNWHMFTIVQDGANIFAYIDAQEVDSATNGSLPTPTSPPNATIGGYIDGPESVNGRLKFARLYNRALSASEIQTLFNFERNL